MPGNPATDGDPPRRLARPRRTDRSGSAGEAEEAEGAAEALRPVPSTGTPPSLTCRGRWPAPPRAAPPDPVQRTARGQRRRRRKRRGRRRRSAPWPFDKKLNKAKGVNINRLTNDINKKSKENLRQAWHRHSLNRPPARPRANPAAAITAGEVDEEEAEGAAEALRPSSTCRGRWPASSAWRYEGRVVWLVQIAVVTSFLCMVPLASTSM